MAQDYYQSKHTGEKIDEGIDVILNGKIVEKATEAAGRAEAAANKAEGDAGTSTDAAGSAAKSAKSAAESAKKAEDAANRAEGAIAGVSSFNGRSGAVKPQKGDYTAEMVGAAPLGEDGKVPAENLPEMNYVKNPTVSGAVGDFLTLGADGPVWETLVNRAVTGA